MEPSKDYVICVITQGWSKLCPISMAINILKIKMAIVTVTVLLALNYNMEPPDLGSITSCMYSLLYPYLKFMQYR